MRGEGKNAVVPSSSSAASGGFSRSAYVALNGPSASKSVKRRVELIRERHGDVIAGNAQAQIRKLFAERSTKIEGLA